MKCVMCKHGETRAGFGSLVFKHSGKKYYVDHVPAQVCATCGEAYFNTETLATLRESFDDVTLPAIPLEARSFQSGPYIQQM